MVGRGRRNQWGLVTRARREVLDLEPTDSHPWSARRAVIGSTAAARRAGTYDATIATPSSSPALAANIQGSYTLVPYIMPRRSRTANDAAPRPTTTPTAVRPTPLPSTTRSTRAGSAPNATRIPISLVRSATRYDNTP